MVATPQHGNGASLGEYARRAYHAALCVVPPREDGSKMPLSEWKQYQKTRPTLKHVDAWYSNGRTGIGIVCGNVSGGAVGLGLEALDFDEHAIWDAFEALARASGLGVLLDRLKAGYFERSPRGVHLLYRCSAISGNTKLAKRPKEPAEMRDPGDKVKTLIETRGEGGYIVVAPSYGQVNPDGIYELVGGSVESIPTISPDERAALFTLARTFDQMPKARADDPLGFDTVQPDGERPGDAFNRLATWSEILEPHGWTAVGEYAGVTRWRRPGKDRYHSATTNHANSDLFYCFSSSTIFEEERGYSKFSVHALLNHDGDFRAAAKALRQQGYGGDSGRATPPRNEADGQPATGSDGLPRIDAGDLDLRIITAQAWDALQRANGDEPYLFRHANTVKRVEPNDAGRLVLAEMTPDRVRHELARCAEFYTVRQSREGPVRRVVLPPTYLVRDLLASPNMPLPVVARVVECPTFGPDGTLQLRRGYHPASRVYCAMPEHLIVPPVPPAPAAADLEAACRLWFEEVLVDFPFVGAADRANALGPAIQPIVRGLIAGPTPLHVAESPSPGSGKGLLIDVLLHPTCGRNAATLSQAGDDDEWRKRLTANVLQGPPAIVFDNLTHTLDSGSLASMLTREDWTDRVLGQTAVVSVPILNAWASTANNVSMSTEIARRSIRIRLDPGQDQPWNRSGPREGQPWRHQRLLEWVDEHRGELLWALLVLAQAWLHAGRPRFSGRALGSYERWTDVIGGILEHAGIDGFLDNLSEFYEQADVETATWRTFVELWWEKYRNAEVGTNELFPLALETDGMDLGTGSEKAQRTVFGKALGRQRDRVIGAYRVIRTREVQRAARWRLLPTDGRGALL